MPGSELSQIEDSVIVVLLCLIVQFMMRLIPHFRGTSNTLNLGNFPNDDLEVLVYISPVFDHMYQARDK